MEYHTSVKKKKNQNLKYTIVVLTLIDIKEYLLCDSVEFKDG